LINAILHFTKITNISKQMKIQMKELSIYIYKIFH
jgi:hypothetical protein